jgi:hypothetical protein
MHESRRSDDIAHDPVDHLHRVLGLAQLEVPRLRTVRTSQLDPIIIEPNHEDLGLDRAVDIPTNRFASHAQGLSLPGVSG